MPDTALDAFKTDDFNLVSMTEAVNLLPYVPSRIEQLGLFDSEAITTDVVKIEYNEGTLGLVQSAKRGAPGQELNRETRRSRRFEVPHLPVHDTIMADDIQGIRKFGTTNETEAINDVVNRRMERMKQDLQTTKEFHKAKALQGLLLDADGSPIYDFWDEFDITESSTDFVLGTSSTVIRTKCLTVIGLIETALGNAAYDHIHALCGPTFFRALIDHANVTAAYTRFDGSIRLRDDPRAGFPYGNIIFEEYRGTVSGQAFVPTGDARFFPVGVRGLFRVHHAPAPYVETVNTLGLTFYAKQELMKFGKGVELEVQSNPFVYCTRPSVLVRGFSSN